MTQKTVNLFMLVRALDAKGEKESSGIRGRGGSVWYAVKPFCGCYLVHL